MEQDKKVFAFISDGDIFHFLTIPDDPSLAGVIAGLQSKPLLIEVTDKQYLMESRNWKYVDGEFIKQVPEDYDDYEVE